jgi:hypothetical protein
MQVDEIRKELKHFLLWLDGEELSKLKDHNELLDEYFEETESNSAPDGSYVFCVDKVEVNDIVDVIFTRNNLFDWQNSCLVADCLVTKIPYATGDTYGFRLQNVDEPTRDFFINPNCSEFAGIEFIKRAQKT